MRKPAKFLTQAVLIIGVLAMFVSCLDPLNFDPENIQVEVDITGNINTTDVTAAVLLLSNQSKTVDVTKVVITRYTGEDALSPEELLSGGMPPEDIKTVIMFENEPQRLSKKAKYLTPSETSYIIDIAYKFYRRDNPAELEGNGSDRLIVPLPLPREIVEVFIYRSTEGVVFVATDRGIDFDVNDTGNPIDDTLVGQGSVPAVIPPENRNRMATFIVVNRTRSQIIDSVRFHAGQSAYTMGAVNVRDKQSIALGQGSWETTLSYRRGGSSGELTVLPSVNSIIVPSNDPQTVKEHYLYFYLDNRGRYQITEIWPPGDESADDILPPDNGNGRGVIKIDNRTNIPINKVTITNLQDARELVINYEQFDPPVLIQNRATYIDIVGTAAFPIDPHNQYQVKVQTNNGAFTLKNDAFIKDSVVEIVIDDFGTPPPPPPPPATPLDITVVSVNYTVGSALTPIVSTSPAYTERTGTIIVEVSGFANSTDAANVELSRNDANSGLSITGLGVVGAITSNSAAFSLSITLQDTQAFASGSAQVSFGIVDNGLPAGQYIVSDTASANITIIDGQSSGALRAIPVRSDNVSAFNAYAGTSAGLTRHYRQTENITLIGANNWTAIKGTDPENIPADRFSGSYDGETHTITGINIDQNADYQGMFGYIDGAAVKNLELKNINITGVGKSNIGGVVGYNNGGTVQYCSVTSIGTISAQDFTGGVVGYNNGGTVEYCSSTATITSSRYDNGGIVGFNDGGLVQNCSFSGSVTGSQSTGGVVGNNNGGTVQNCSANGDVFSDITRTSDGQAGFNAGGVLGYNRAGIVTNCEFTNGTVKGTNSVGGVVGKNESSVSNCQANGTTVTGTGIAPRVGGVVGWNTSTGTVTGCSPGGGTTPGTVVGQNDNP